MALVTVLGGGKNMPWSGWEAPGVHERTVMKKNCGSKCFLSPSTNGFPICDPGTCNINDKGVWAAYVRGREYASKKMRRKGKTHRKRQTKRSYGKIASRARKILRKRGYKL